MSMKAYQPPQIYHKFYSFMFASRACRPYDTLRQTLQALNLKFVESDKQPLPTEQVCSESRKSKLRRRTQFQTWRNGTRCGLAGKLLRLCPKRFDLCFAELQWQNYAPPFFFIRPFPGKNDRSQMPVSAIKIRFHIVFSVLGSTISQYPPS